MHSPKNEPVRPYAPADATRASLQKKLAALSASTVEIPCIIGGKEIRTGQTKNVVMPHAHRHIVAKAHWAGPKELEQAAVAALRAGQEWASWTPQARQAVFERAADLLAGSWRDTINASTMLGQSKSVYQAEIDAACELIDFFRFNNFFYGRLRAEQPISPDPGITNRLEYRPLEGFVLAITPFNFTSIAANLPAAPALLGNTVVWKPSDTQLYSAYFTMKLFEEAGLPPGVINFVPADGPVAGEALLPHHELAGVHFTGSTATFERIWTSISGSLSRYRSYPRVVGETGGKDFVFAHATAECESLAVALLRGAFEYQGQKCSAASRAYIPKSIWPVVKERLLSDLKTLKMGDPKDFTCFMNAVIDERAFDKITGFIERARTNPKGTTRVIAGGGSSKEVGYFVEPTVIQTDDPRSETMVEEIFGPVLTVYVYDDSELEQTLTLCDTSTPYALTGAIFAQDEKIIEMLSRRLRNAAGNFYINDKPTGAVVGQQPFGGARRSGTNDKAGSLWNLVRWTSPQTIKRTQVPPRDYRYPFLAPDLTS